MATIFTVGFGGTHVTLQAAYDAIPNPPTGGYEIHVLKQEFTFTGSTLPLNITARTTSATNYIKIKAAPGAGFKDNSGVRTNPLRYDANKGAAIRCQNSAAISVSGLVNHLTIEGLQLRQAAGDAFALDVLVTLPGVSPTNLVLKDLIIEIDGGGLSEGFDGIFVIGTGIKIINCVVIHGGKTVDTGIKLSDFATGLSGQVIGCTVVRPSNLSASGIGIFNKAIDNNLVCIDCLSLNFSTDYSQLSAGSAYNGTNFSSGSSSLPTGANNTYSIPNTTATFEQPSMAGGLQDFRLKRASLAENVGLYDGVNAPADITGLVRTDPPDLGCWEIEPLNPLTIDDRTIELPSVGQTIMGIRLNPIVVGDDFRIKRTYMGLPTGVVILKAWLTVKKSFRLTDAQALMNKPITMIESSQGRITDGDTAGGGIAMYFDLLAAETLAALPDTEYLYGIKALTVAGQIHTLEEGFIPFTRRATEAVV